MSTAAAPKTRILSIDILRGIIMIIMALDHVRDYFTNVPYDPLDLTQTSPALFLTRWITHFCAPTFIFLSGVSAYLSLSKKENKRQSAAFLLKRGLWLIFMELTLIRIGWSFHPGFEFIFVQVIWAIGWSMIFLSALIFLRPAYIAFIGLLIIFGHNALDGVNAENFGKTKWVWMMLHQQGNIPIGKEGALFILYPIVPWIGVMAAGYAFGTLYQQEAAKRKKTFLAIGLGSLLLFLVLRGGNIYGDLYPWQHQDSLLKTIFAIIKCHKYPPSLAYLLMTLGVSITALAVLPERENKLSRIIMVYGSTPFFYYVLHIYLIHIAQLLVGLLTGYSLTELFASAMGNSGKWGFDLPVVYLVWILVVAALYLPCKWFMKVKKTRKDWWLSYL